MFDIDTVDIIFSFLFEEAELGTCQITFSPTHFTCFQCPILTIRPRPPTPGLSRHKDMNISIGHSCSMLLMITFPSMILLALILSSIK